MFILTSLALSLITIIALVLSNYAIFKFFNDNSQRIDVLRLFWFFGYFDKEPQKNDALTLLTFIMIPGVNFIIFWVIILTFRRYCRYRRFLKETNQW